MEGGGGGGGFGAQGAFFLSTVLQNKSDGASADLYSKSFKQKFVADLHDLYTLLMCRPVSFQCQLFAPPFAY